MSNFVVSISGFGWSGSTAARDLLREYNYFNHFDREYGLVSDPNGFIDLENVLVDDWNYIKVDRAIKQFTDFARQVAGRRNVINHFGLGIEKEFGVNFEEILNQFVHDLSLFKYNFASRVNYNYLSLLDKILFKVMARIGNYKEEHIFSSPTELEFLNAVRAFHRSLFSNSLKEKNLILEKAIPVNNISKSIRYFDDVRVVVVDRDPRDVFIDMSSSNGLFWGGRSTPVSESKVQNYIKWKNEMYRRSALSDLAEFEEKVLYIKFEDLVCDYENSTSKLENFLQLDSRNHLNKGKYFNPDKSAKNVGKWKNYEQSDLIDSIKEGIPY